MAATSAESEPTLQVNVIPSPTTTSGNDPIPANSSTSEAPAQPQTHSQANLGLSPASSLQPEPDLVQTLQTAVTNIQPPASEMRYIPPSQFSDFPDSTLLNQPDPFGLALSPPFMNPLIDDEGGLANGQENRNSSSPNPSPSCVTGGSPPGVVHTEVGPGQTGSSPVSSPMSSGSELSVPYTPSPSTRVRYARTYLHGQRLHPTRAKPSFGTMIAHKGSSQYEVVRTGSLVGRVDRKDMNRRFTRGLDRILLNCEKLADETGCWLYIGTNHPSVHGEYVHWMSPSMRQDLPADTRLRFDKTAGSLFSALKAARRQNIVDVHLEASQCRAELDAAKADAARKQALINKLTEYVNNQGGDMTRFLDSSHV
ncbi:hypothetical protein AAF712_015683 [Marasmius tenuissimus]|uniref:Uncharacterized protein n=1 Tax=Marasmius tenuissimus TaxID=585030 RepID=A0ABR2Z8J7_9AGAR